MDQIIQWVLFMLTLVMGGFLVREQVFGPLPGVTEPTTTTSVPAEVPPQEPTGAPVTEAPPRPVSKARGERRREVARRSARRGHVDDGVAPAAVVR